MLCSAQFAFYAVLRSTWRNNGPSERGFSICVVIVPFDSQSVARTTFWSVSEGSSPEGILLVYSKPSQHNTPIEVTPLAAETVRVTDPTHPFYGLELPLVGVTRTARIGAVCVVWIRRGVERVVPVEATDLAEGLLEPPSPCRLSADSAKALLAVVASFSQAPPEEAHAAETRHLAPEPTDPAVRDPSATSPSSGGEGSHRGSLRSTGDVADAGYGGTGAATRNMDTRAEGGRG